MSAGANNSLIDATKKTNTLWSSLNNVWSLKNNFNSDSGEAIRSMTLLLSDLKDIATSFSEEFKKSIKHAQIKGMPTEQIIDTIS